MHTRTPSRSIAHDAAATRCHIERIKHDLRSVSTCGPDTVAALQDVLLSAKQDHMQKENVRAKNTKAASVQVQTGRKGASKAATAPVNVIEETPTSPSHKTKYILATEVANITLKSLSEAVKDQSLVHRPKTPSKPHASPTITASRSPASSALHPPSRTASQPRKPLHERSTSQIASCPKKRALRRSSSYSSCLKTGPAPSLVATAECARIAFAYLRTAEAVQIIGRDAPSWQLENGMLALVGKLVAHGLYTLAVKELRMLKRRLDSFLGNGHTKPQATRAKEQPAPKKAPAGLDKESLASLLDCGDVAADSPALPIVISHQIYAVRVLAAIRQPKAIEEAWSYLKLSNLCSPANLIMRYAETANGHGKAARQLESLAQAILSLCPSVAGSDDASSSKDYLQVLPDVSLCLQHLAFKIRQRWWKLANHQGNLERELLDPFAKCVAAFSRRSSLPAIKKYNMADTMYRDLSATNLGRSKTSKGDNPSSELIQKVMGSLAQAAGLTDEALRWMGQIEIPKNDRNSAAKSACRAVRLAALSLEASTKGTVKPELIESIADAVGALSGGLGGSSSELESLFLEVNALRRIASRGLSVVLQGPSTESIQGQAFDVVTASIHFTARYFGAKPPDGADSKAQLRYGTRIAMAAKTMKPLLDSMWMCTKRVESEEQWVRVDAVIRDCLYIVTQVQTSIHAGTTGVEPPLDVPHPFVKISNAYWACYMQLKEANLGFPVLMEAMQQSTEILIPRSQEEQCSGMLAMKLEKLGEVLDANGRGHASSAAFCQALHTLVECGSFDIAVQMAARRPLPQIIDEDRAMRDVARLIKLVHRSFVQHGLHGTEHFAFFDNTKMPAAARGLLLEWQLVLFRRSLAKNRPWKSVLNPSMRILIERLLELYNSTDFPLRRQRTCTLLAQLSDEHPEIFPSEVLPKEEEQHLLLMETNGHDEGLLRFKRHLDLMFSLRATMRLTNPSLDTIKHCLTAWQDIVDAASSWSDVVEKVDDSVQWLREIQGITDFLAATGQEYVCLRTLNLMTRILELKKGHDSSQLIATLCNFSLQLLRLGYSEKAGLALAKAETLTLAANTSTESKVQWHLAYAEYLFRIGNSPKCHSNIVAAETLALSDADLMSLAQPSTPISGRTRFNRLLADACYIHSLLALNSGCQKDALRHAKRCVGLNRRIWSAFEQKVAARKAAQTEEMEVSGEDTSKMGFDPLASLRNENGVPLVQSMTHDTLNAPDLWSLVASLHRAMLLHSTVFANQGLLNEAVFVAEQADKVASATRADSLLIQSSSCRAEYWAQSGRPDKAQKVLEDISGNLLTKHLSMVYYYSAVARTQHASGALDDELTTYTDLESLLHNLDSPTFLKNLELFDSGVGDLTEQMSAVSLGVTTTGTKKPLRAAPRGRKPAKKLVPKAARKLVEEAPNRTPGTSEECSLLCTLKADVARRKALTNLVQDNLAQATLLLEQAQQVEKRLGGNVLNLWVNFKTLVYQSMTSVAKDFTFNSLPESTIAFPALGQGERKLSECVMARTAVIQQPVAASAKGAKGKKRTSENFVATLQQARDLLAEAHSLSRTGSIALFQQISSTLGYLTVILSATSTGELRGPLHPVYVAYMSELPKSRSWKLAQVATEVDQEILSRDDLMRWPTLESHREDDLAPADFQREYIDIIPEPWTVISLALNDDHDELYITRYQADHTPFVLRLPMSRHQSRDVDEDDFNFEQGKKDFDEIIELSDFSTKTAKDMTSKDARSQWWDEREALDTRLHELLLNMENIWLGGFKGIVSQHPRQPTLLARFRKSFETILQRHLPSRQTKKQQQKIALDSRVLELFIGLGDATDEKLDLDEALMDLIYFVVDILQFNGEQNAYDEIDFDAIVIDTLDALRAYHSALQVRPSQQSHTILLLDKNLHGFPWESMPCMQNLSISRLPSLAALRERLLAANPAAKTPNARPGHYISASSGGTSILNPSGDLMHTLNTIKPRLDDMDGLWTHITSHAPSESEFEAALGDKDLVLYFGHGSGAQFIRSKSVRRLYKAHTPKNEQSKPKPNCATAFLFGCSSAHLTENGIYEPSGMLSSYMTAGAPAVLGMLWDVTDKDCDRFAVRTGELWGLWSESSASSPELPKSVKKGGTKGKSKVAQLVAEVETARGTKTARRGRKGKTTVDDMDLVGEGVREKKRGVGLDEAVRDARGACYLRYLNGAAAVVYGIPVFLE